MHLFHKYSHESVQASPMLHAEYTTRNTTDMVFDFSGLSLVGNMDNKQGNYDRVILMYEISREVLQENVRRETGRQGEAKDC